MTFKCHGFQSFGQENSPYSRYGYGDINPTQNIWKGLRYKVFLDVNMPSFKTALNNGKATLNFGFDARYYKQLYRNFIWAGRAAADFSWGEQKIVYYLGGTDGWLGPKFNDNPPAPDQTYAFQSLALNMRGYNQNVANGNNAFVINSEFRFPLFSTLINRPINNAFLRNFQLVQVVDLGTAWNGKYNGITRPGEFYSSPGSTPVTVRIDAGGLGPFAGGYGFGERPALPAVQPPPGWQTQPQYHQVVYRPPPPPAVA